jgi:type II restriction enzyme
MNIAIKSKENQGFSLHSSRRGRPTKITTRTLTLKSNIIDFVNKYLSEVSLYDETKKITGLRSDWIRDIYNSVPNILLTEINEEEDVYTEYLQIPKILVETSVNPDKWSDFEEYITKSFNLFEDVEAERIGGAGEPDSLCTYSKKNIIFCADGKSTKKKLSSINDGRLKQHRSKYNASYTIVVTPGYVPSAVEDIKGTDTCIITSYCFADLITKYIFKLYKNNEECSYEIFNNLILNNLGTDLSEKIYKIIDDKLGIAIDSL